MRLGITEILLILVLALVIFGGSKLSGEAHRRRQYRVYGKARGTKHGGKVRA